MTDGWADMVAQGAGGAMRGRRSSSGEGREGPRPTLGGRGGPVGHGAAPQSPDVARVASDLANAPSRGEGRARPGLTPVPGSVAGAVAIRHRLAGMCALALALLLPAAAHAGAWADFEVRCLSALEAQVPPVVAGLGQGARQGDVTRYALNEGRELRVDTAPADGMRACAVRDPAGAAVPGFDDWIAGAVAAGRYVATGPATWHSHLWIEPVLELQKSNEDGVLTLRIVETRLEA